MHCRLPRLPVPVRPVLHVSEVPLHGGLALLTLFGMDAANEYQCRIYIMLLSMHISYIGKQKDRQRQRYQIRLDQIRFRQTNRQIDRQMDGWIDRLVLYTYLTNWVPNKLGMYIHIYIYNCIYNYNMYIYICIYTNTNSRQMYAHYDKSIKRVRLCHALIPQNPLEPVKDEETAFS